MIFMNNSPIFLIPLRISSILFCGFFYFIIGPISNNALRSFNLVSIVEKVDCKTSSWKHEPCNATCGEGIRWKQRSIIVSFYDTDIIKADLERNPFTFDKLTATSKEWWSSMPKKESAF